MVVGRRHVAAASVATAYALHVFQHHFRPPQTDRPSQHPFLTHSHCRKLGVQHSCSGLLMDVDASLLYPLYIYIHRSLARIRSLILTLTLDPSNRFALFAWTLSIHHTLSKSHTHTHALSLSLSLFLSLSLSLSPPRIRMLFSCTLRKAAHRTTPYSFLL